MIFMDCARPGLLGATYRSGAYDPVVLIAAPTYFNSLYSYCTAPMPYKLC